MNRLWLKRKFLPRGRLLSLAACWLAAACSGESGSAIVNIPGAPASVPQAWLDRDCRLDSVPDERDCRLYQASKLPPLDSAKRDHFGEEYSPQKFAECLLRALKEKRGDICEKYRLRRHENPEFWPYPNVPKPKLPEAPNPPTYKKGMSAEEYFNALCEKEAGEFIYRTVENVDGLYAVRPRDDEGGDERVRDRYVIEDPFDFFTMTGMHPENQLGFSYLYVSEATPYRGGYRFFETARVPAGYLSRAELDASLFEPKPTDRPYERYSGYDSKSRKSMKKEFDSQIKARYGFTWRGIDRPNDRDMGIKGGELIVLDLKTNEVLGIRRNFVRSGGKSGNSFHWYSSQSCPALRSQASARTKQWVDEFIARVLKPVGRIETQGVK